MKEFYFDKFDGRKPYPSIPFNRYRNLLFQLSGVITVVLGLSYLYWRWRFSLNPDSIWFSVILVLAETMSFVSTVMVVINFWSNKDAEKTPPVHYLSDIEELEGRKDRPLRIDVFIATYNESAELVRLSIL